MGKGKEGVRGRRGSTGEGVKSESERVTGREEEGRMDCLGFWGG